MLYLAVVDVDELEVEAVAVGHDEHYLGFESGDVVHECTAAHALGDVELLDAGCGLALGCGGVYGVIVAERVAAALHMSPGDVEAGCAVAAQCQVQVVVIPEVAVIQIELVVGGSFQGNGGGAVFVHLGPIGDPGV